MPENALGLENSAILKMIKKIIPTFLLSHIFPSMWKQLENKLLLIILVVTYIYSFKFETVIIMVYFIISYHSF